jgi:hypothetical protein
VRIDEAAVDLGEAKEDFALTREKFAANGLVRERLDRVDAVHLVVEEEEPADLVRRRVIVVFARGFEGRVFGEVPANRGDDARVV